MKQTLGLIASAGFTGAVVTGIAALIALDFQSAWEAYVAPEQAIDVVPEATAVSPFKDVDGITFFITTPVAGSGHEVVTGAAFASPEAVAQRRAERLWCYLNQGFGIARTRIDLGSKEGQLPPVYTRLTGLDRETLDELGRDAAALEAIAKSHCKFANFDPKAAS